MFIKTNTTINGSDSVRENCSGTKSVPPNDHVSTVYMFLNIGILLVNPFNTVAYKSPPKVIKTIKSMSL